MGLVGGFLDRVATVCCPREAGLQSSSLRNKVGMGPVGDAWAGGACLLPEREGPCLQPSSLRNRGGAMVLALSLNLEVPGLGSGSFSGQSLSLKHIVCLCCCW